MADADDQIITTDTESPSNSNGAPETPETNAPPALEPKRRSGLLGPVLGGVLAAGAGFGVAQYVPDGWPIADTTTLQATIDAQAADIAALKDQIAQLPQPTATPPTDLAPLNTAIADLTARLAAVESAPAQDAGLSQAVAALQSDLAALKSSGPIPANVAALTAEAEARLAEAQAAAEQVKSEAEAVAKAAAARAVFNRLEAAVNSGAPYADILPDLGLAAPAALQDHSETGLPSLTALQDSFPAAARAALEAALRADMGDSWTERATSFFRSQTGARSLTPQQGNDPDAVLSRAEAALAAGDLGATLAELSGLPEAAQSAVADWRTMAERRQAAQSALTYIAGKFGE